MCYSENVDGCHKINQSLRGASVVFSLNLDQYRHPLAKLTTTRKKSTEKKTRMT